MLWILVLLIFYLLNGLTIMVVIYLTKRYLFKKNTQLKNSIGVGLFFGILIFILGYFFITGMEHLK